tara:strand:+ start:265 stop:417 length:153 start_codon:yes stop_codon:yes gene_type:complete
LSCLWVDDVVVDRGLVIPYLNFSGLDDVLISIDVGREVSIFVRPLCPVII